MRSTFDLVKIMSMSISERNQIMKTKLGHFVLTILWLAAVLFGTTLGTKEIAVAENTSAPQKTQRPAEGDTEKNPLLPADTSSPRDTLEGFLRDLTIALEDYRKNGGLSSAESYRAYYRALSMLDFSATPDGNSWLVINRRILMLKEILDRIALPPETEIPGDDEVARENLTQWTIPGTNITIQRAEKGAQTGKFLFSAGTVQRLHRFYRKVKHLPYKPESTPGFYEAFTRSERSSHALQSAMRNRLRPVNTTSPRSTLEGFLDNINRACALVMEADAALKASPPTITMDEAREMEQRADNLMDHAAGTLDLSKVSKAVREDVGTESALQLKEILDRLDLPPTDVIPDAEMVKAKREHLGGTASGEGKPFRWQIPNTTIEIVEIMEGENQGKFLFSADTVSNLVHLYQKIRDFPYRRDSTHLEPEYMRLEKKTEGFYDYYISTPGYLISRISPLDQWVKRLPDWFKKVYGGQTLWQWMTLVLALCLGGLFLVMLQWVILRRLSHLSPAGRHWRRVIFNLIAMGVLYWLSGILDDTVNLTGSVLQAVLTGLSIIYWFFLATGVFFFSQAVSESIVASPKIDPDGAKASIYRAIFGVVGFLAMAVLMITGLHEVGVSLVPLLASVGLGGFAIALAARPTLENVIGSFMIFLDKPYRVGQRVNILGHNGTIESIGLRSTKIRLLTGHQTSIPNEKMASVEIENIGRRPFIRRRFNVTITYDTPPEKIIRAEEILKEILAVP